ncbi:MAG: hypothetical protein V8S95_08335 [Odoribacter sp.]
MITLGVCLLGIISYNKLGTDLFPDLKNPALYIELEAGERPRPRKLKNNLSKGLNPQLPARKA